MPIDQLIFVGLNGYVVALHRETGEVVWYNDQLRSGIVTLLLDGDRLMVSVGGRIYCLQPGTGKVLWENPMKGYGFFSQVGLPAMASARAAQAGVAPNAAATVMMMG